MAHASRLETGPECPPFEYSVAERAINEAEFPLNLERGLHRGRRELRLSYMAQHKLQLSIYCSVRRNQHQALHFFSAGTAAESLYISEHG